MRGLREGPHTVAVSGATPGEELELGTVGQVTGRVQGDGEGWVCRRVPPAHAGGGQPSDAFSC